jgi:DNA replication regulator SLD2
MPHPMAPIDEEASHAMLPPRRMKSMSRSFSSIIQELKNQEEERMEDDWDVLNELEAEENGTTVPKKQAEQVQVADSQLVVMPLGPDRAPGECESEEEVALGANGLPRKAYKKKGLKRQTRKSNIKPVLHKPKKAADLEEKIGSDDEESVEETQPDGPEGKCVDGVQVEEGEQDAEKSTNPIKRVAQKVSQNFRRMNIKSHQTAKQKAKGKGRFGKR